MQNSKTVQSILEDQQQTNCNKVLRCVIMKSYITTTTKLYLRQNQYITSADYLQIAKLIEAGSIETYHLHLNCKINTKNVTK